MENVLNIVKDPLETVIIKTEITAEFNSESFACANTLEQLACKKCDSFKCYSLVDLKEHIKSDHKKVKFSRSPYYCEVCDFTSYSLYIFKTHNCNVRSDQFFTKAQLRENVSLLRQVLKTHPSRSVKLWHCNKCSFKVYGVPSKFKRHEMCHAAEKGELFRCQQCSYTSTRLGNLQRHLEIHVGATLQCSYCSFTCRQKRTYHKHFLEHTRDSGSGSTDLRCKQCPYSTYKLSNLLRHNEVHINAHLQCKECNYSCKTKKAFSHHVRKHERRLM